MSRIANERTILAIESIVDADRPSLEAVAWRSHDVDCRRDRHRFVGQSYAFSIEILEMRLTRKSHMLWHLVVVTERWQRPGPAGSDLRTSKWLKQLAGKTSDVVDWLRDCRPLFATPNDSLDQE